MSKHDWYRKTSWSPGDANDFERHLARARSQRTQYLKIQAWTLADTGRPEVADAAIDLANRYLQEEPDGFHTVEAHLVIADANLLKQRSTGALQAFRVAVAAEARISGPRCCAYLHFAWFVSTHDLVEHQQEALEAMDSMEAKDLIFPIAQYKYFGALALISESLGDHDYARRMATNALEAAAKPAPFPRHKDVGIVEGVDDEIQRRLREIVA